MSIKVTRVQKSDLLLLIADMQQAFQLYHEERFGASDSITLPKEDIESVLSETGAVFYKAETEGKIVAGAIVTIDENAQHNFLELFYVKHGEQNKGIGSEVWKQIEQLHPETRVWETCVRSDEARNVHFYINKCGFRLADFMKGIPEDERTVLVLYKYM